MGTGLARNWRQKRGSDMTADTFEARVVAFMNGI
jgi:hypothetical protein